MTGWGNSSIVCWQDLRNISYTLVAPKNEKMSVKPVGSSEI